MEGKGKVVNTKIPVRFEEVENYDSRFQKVKIWLMHLGKNYNGSVFDKEPVLNALDTLKNTPILGYIEESKLGDKDFRGHEVELVIENGEMKEKYLGHAFGVIPETCNPRFEFKEGDNGEILEYLVVDGLLWTKFDDAYSILKDRGEVSESMELHDDYDGYWDEEGWFHFNKFSFYGACMLGSDVSPAMQKASVEMVFSKDAIKEEISKKLEEFSLLMNSKQSKEVGNKMTLEELLAKYSISIEDLTAKEVNVEEYSIEDLETKIQELFSDTSNDESKDDEPQGDESEFTDEQKEEPKDEPNPEFTDEPQGESDKFTLSFELSHEDIRSKMWNQIDDFMANKGLGNDWYYIVSVFDSNVIVENDMGNNFYRIDYSIDGDNINFGDVTEVYPMFLTQEEKGALDLMRANFEKIEQENTRLKQFEAQVLEQQRQLEIEQLFERPEFSKLTDEDLGEIKTNIDKFSVVELESKLYEVLGRKNATKFSSQKSKQEPQKVTIKIEENATSSSPYSHILKRQGLI